MTFFTGLGIFIAAFFGYMMLFGIGVIITSDDAGYFGAVFVGITLSLVLAIFICSPESYGYQKITVSENVVEANR